MYNIGFFCNTCLDFNIMRYLCEISYDGTKYNGFQKQPNKKTIQREIEQTLCSVFKKEIKIFASGRTDKGVHAIGQCIHFDLEFDIKRNQIKEILNRSISKDIVIKKVKKVSDNFHARHSATSKKYVYKISKKSLSVFDRNYSIYIKNLDYEKMKKAALDFVGNHDYKNFSKNDIPKPTNKTIFAVKITESKRSLSFEIHGNSFLKYMVRKMIGTLLDIGKGKKDKDFIKNVFSSKEKNINIPSAPACGLYLKKVYYK